MKNLREDLLHGRTRIGVWGCGFIGFSSMVNFATNGVKCIGFDINPNLVENINSGKIPLPNLEYWLGFDVSPLMKDGIVEATTDWKNLMKDDVSVHLVAIPTEKGDKPWDGALVDVMEKLATKEKNSEILIIVESTLTPNRTEKTIIPIFEKTGHRIGENIKIGVAPRRDWFISPEKSLKNLPRIIGGTNKETAELMRQVLGIVCDTLYAASDHKHAELVKSIENAYRHMEITLANQLSRAYPDINMREVLKLVGTKWNIGTYQPSFGTGGYCIPLSSQYVLEGAPKPDELTLLTASINTDNKQPVDVAKSVVNRGAKKVGILGLSYKGDLKVHILSPTIKIVSTLKEHGIEAKVHDPYYTGEEIEKITGAKSFDFPQGLKEFDTIIIVADHKTYKAITADKILKNLENCNTVLDNTAVWEPINFSGTNVKYYKSGDAGWMNL